MHNSTIESNTKNLSFSSYKKKKFRSFKALKPSNHSVIESVESNEITDLCYQTLGVIKLDFHLLKNLYYNHHLCLTLG